MLAGAAGGAVPVSVDISADVVEVLAGLVMMRNKAVAGSHHEIFCQTKLWRGLLAVSLEPPHKLWRTRNMGWLISGSFNPHSG